MIESVSDYNLRPSARYLSAEYLNSELVADVRDFQIRRMGNKLPLSPVVADEAVRAVCIGLTYEELRELHKALINGDLELTVDAVADLIYVLVGVALLHGVDIGPILAEVHLANMEKEKAAPGLGRITKDGRSTKANWTPPRIAELLDEQRKSR